MTSFSSNPPELNDPNRGTMALLGHDLRAALSDVIGGLRLVDIRSLEPATRLQLERVRASGESLARFLEEALFVVEGHQRPDSAHDQVQLDHFLAELGHRWRGRATEKGLTFEVTVEPDLPQTIQIDRIGIERVLSNLLSNAIKFTDYGWVKCHVAMMGPANLAFQITDTGAGFSDEALASLFQPRARPASSTKPGTGMGLHITKDILERMGGEITVLNQNDSGSQVEVYFPLLAESGAGSRQVQSDKTDHDLHPFRLLVADDSRTNQLLMARMLTDQGANVTVAPDGASALERLSGEKFDALILDIEMPQISGLDVIHTLRQSKGPAANIPIIAVTAYVLRSNRAAILAAGADTIVSKPIFCPITFGAAVRSAISLRAGQDTAQPVTAVDTSADRARAVLPNLYPLRRLMAIAGPEAGEELLVRLREDLQMVERSLITAIATLDWETLRNQTHVLISLAGTVGATPLQKQAEFLNSAAHRMNHIEVSHTQDSILKALDTLIQFVFEADVASLAEDQKG